MRKEILSIYSFFILCCFVYISHSKVLSGTVDSTQDTVYFGKFTYSTASIDDPGTLIFSVEDVAPQYDWLQQNILLNFYTDQEDSPWYFYDIWDNSDLTCEQKVALQFPVNGQFGIPVNDTDLKITITGEHPTTWFWTISDCDLKEGQYLQMHTQMHWENPGSYWESEFSVEDQNVLTIYFVFVFFWILLFIVAIICVYIFFMRTHRDIDWNMYFYLLSLGATTLASALYTFHYLIYAGDGIGLPSVLVIADVMTNISEIGIMVSFLQIASLVGSPDKMNPIVQLLAGLLVGLYMIFFLWQEIYEGLNPTSLLYKWETTPGIIMLVDRIVIWFMFVVLCVINAFRNADRRYFLGIFGGIFSIWFLCLPFMVLVMIGTKYYEKAKVVLGIVQTFYFILYCIFLLLATPNPLSSRINGVGFYVRKFANDLSSGNANFLTTKHTKEEDEEL